jgi:glycosyltransferase involved in cell wall biosynthesis
MSVVYFFRAAGKYSGVNKKVTSQIQSLRAAGVNCIAYIIYSGDSPDSSETFTQAIEVPHFNNRIKFINKIRRELFIIGLMESQISLLKDHDILYMRIPYPSFLLSRLLSRSRRCKIVFEYQTIEPLEYRSMGKYWYLFIDYLFGDDIRKYSDAIVGVTDEITRYELSRSGDINKPHITIGNGYYVESVSIRDPPEFSDHNLDLLCVSNVRLWQGLDRLIRGLAAYQGTTKVTFHIAGEGTELAHLKQIAADLDVLDNVIFHGIVTGGALEDLYNQCHVAIGTLGIHRKGLTQGSTLKSREYFARGIPFIIASSDPDIPSDYPYVCTIPPDESPVSIERIVEFAQRICRDSEHPQIMRSYASEHLDWSKKMCGLKRFLELLIGDNANSSADTSAHSSTKKSGDPAQ